MRVFWYLIKNYKIVTWVWGFNYLKTIIVSCICVLLVAEPNIPHRINLFSELESKLLINVMISLQTLSIQLQIQSANSVFLILKCASTDIWSVCIHKTTQVVKRLIQTSEKWLALATYLDLRPHLPYKGIKSWWFPSFSSTKTFLDRECIFHHDSLSISLVGVVCA